MQEAREQVSVAVASEKGGYLQSLDVGQLLEVATKKDFVLDVIVKPGDHVVEGDEIVRVWGVEELVGETLERVRGSFLYGGERTPMQDIRYQFQQLTEVVVRALSPGINDPFTAVNGIDEMTTGVSLLVRRGRPAGERLDEDGRLRLILTVSSVMDILQESVGHIAIYGAGDPFVMGRLRRLLEIAEPHLSGEGEMRTLAALRAALDRSEQARAAG